MKVIGRITTPTEWDASPSQDTQKVYYYSPWTEGGRGIQFTPFNTPGNRKTETLSLVKLLLVEGEGTLEFP